MTPSSLIERAGEVLRGVAAEAVLPRYQALAEHQIEEKGPGDLVTVADRESEALLEARLGALVPEARFVGEEACAFAPELADTIGEGLVWVVDPIDGTGNFAAGRPPFAIMAALLRDGDTIAAWIHDPLGATTIAAESGGGTWRDGTQVRASQETPETLRGVISDFYLPDEKRGFAQAIRAAGTVVPSKRCAGHEYPLVAEGALDFALYWRTLAWDHAPGALILSEAGGAALRSTGVPYRPGTPGAGIVLAHNAAIAERLLAAGRRG